MPEHEHTWARFSRHAKRKLVSVNTICNAGAIEYTTCREHGRWVRLRYRSERWMPSPLLGLVVTSH